MGANSSRSLDAAAFVSDGGSRPARRCVWSGPCGEEFAPDTSASARVRYRAELLTVNVSSTLRRNELGAIASAKNDCNFPQRSDDNRDGARQRDSGKSAGISAPNEPEENATSAPRYRYGATQRKTVSA